MKNKHHSTLSRRQFLAASAGTALVARAATARGQESTPESGEWTFTGVADAVSTSEKVTS